MTVASGVEESGKGVGMGGQQDTVGGFDFPGKELAVWFHVTDFCTFLVLLVLIHLGIEWDCG